MTRAPTGGRLVGSMLLVLLVGRVAAAQASRPDWLHLAPSAAPQASSLAPSLLRLSDEREARYAEQGYGTAELLRRYELEWGEGGELVERSTRIRQYLSDDGVRQWGNLELGVRSQMQELWIDEAWIALPDGRRRAVDLDSVQLVTGGAASDVFSDGVTVVVPFDGLVAGATAVLVTRVVERTSDWPLPWSEIFHPQGWAPVERFEFEMSWDPASGPRMLHTDGAFLKCEEGPGRTRCEGEQIPPVPAGEERTIWPDALPQLVVAETREWTDLAQAERALLDRSMAEDEGLDRALSALLDGADDEQTKLDRIHRFVADEIRYLGLEHGPSAVAPTAVERTLDLRYGDCKGKVALFVAMARRAGIRAFPVLVSTGRNGLDKLALPSWRYFDHMIACAELAGAAKPVCLDLTTPNARTGLLPPGLLGSVALDLRDGVEAPRAIDTPNHAYDIEVTAENRIDCQGNLTEVLERRFLGAGAVWERGSLRGLTVEQRERWGKEDYQAVFGTESEPKVDFGGVEDPAAPLVFRTTTAFQEVLGAEMTEYREADTWLRNYASWFKTSNVRHPAFVPGVRIRSRMNYQLCPTDRVQFVGAALNMESEFGTLKRDYRRKAARVEVDTVLKLHPQTVRGKDLARYQRFLNAALDQTQAWFRLERGAVGGDMP